MNDGSITKKTEMASETSAESSQVATSAPVVGADWRAFDQLSDEERRAAAVLDPDAEPLTTERWGRMTPVPRVRTLRRALGLSQLEFSDRFQIPLANVRDWEQGRTVPDQAARAYLKVIAAAPDLVLKALTDGKQRDM